MAGSAIFDIRSTFGAIFVGLLLSTTSVLLCSVFAGLFWAICFELEGSLVWHSRRRELEWTCSPFSCWQIYCSGRWLYFWWVVIVSESNKLTSLRHYHDRDPKTLKFFIAFITCVVWLNSSTFKLIYFIRILDVLHTVMSAYVNYWWVWSALTILQFLTLVGTYS